MGGKREGLQGGLRSGQQDPKSATRTGDTVLRRQKPEQSDEEARGPPLLLLSFVPFVTLSPSVCVDHQSLSEGRRKSTLGELWPGVSDLKQDEGSPALGARSPSAQGEPGEMGQLAGAQSPRRLRGSLCMLKTWDRASEPSRKGGVSCGGGQRLAATGNGWNKRVSLE